MKDKPNQCCNHNCKQGRSCPERFADTKFSDADEDRKIGPTWIGSFETAIVLVVIAVVISGYIERFA